MKLLKSFYRTFCTVEETICNIGFMAMIALVFVSAIARNIGHPLAWSIDVAQLMLCWTTLIGADVAFRHGKFMGLDILTCKFPEKMQTTLKIIMDAIILVALVIFVIFGTRLSIDSWQRSFQTLKISYSFVTIALPVMSTVMSVSVVLDIIHLVSDLKAPAQKES